MIRLLENSHEYNNDLRAMLMAFYPGEVITEKEDADARFTLVCDYDDAGATLHISALSIRTGQIYGMVTGTERAIGDYKDRQNFRNAIKLAIYHLLSAKTGRILPWGDLTGMRPTKIAMKALQEGETPDDIRRMYREVYEVSEAKTELALDVAQHEIRLLTGLTADDYCLYIGIPFCPSRCLYCSFTSYPIELYRGEVDTYIERLTEEVRMIRDLTRGRRLAACYIGGGTPSSIDETQTKRLLSGIAEIYPELAEGRIEYTVEAGRPDSITAGKLAAYRAYGVNRISINPQTMHDETLARIGRAHSVQDVKDAFAMARAEGFTNINMDLIAGLPGEDASMMRKTLAQVEDLAPESLTIHSLAVKRAARLREEFDAYGDTIHRDMEEMLDLADASARGMGMEPYYMYRQKNMGGNLENIGYAKPGAESMYNILIMEEMIDIMAAGAGAVTKPVRRTSDNLSERPQRVDRIENCKSLRDYLDRFPEMMDRKEKAFRRI